MQTTTQCCSKQYLDKRILLVIWKDKFGPFSNSPVFLLVEMTLMSSLVNRNKICFCWYTGSLSVVVDAVNPAAAHPLVSYKKLKNCFCSIIPSRLHNVASVLSVFFPLNYLLMCLWILKTGSFWNTDHQCLILISDAVNIQPVIVFVLKWSYHFYIKNLIIFWGIEFRAHVFWNPQ